MSELIGFVGVSHSPFATLLPPHDRDAPGASFLAEVDRVRRTVERLAPDLVVVIGPDHFHANFYDVMPPFVVGVEEAVGFGDYGSRAGKLPVARTVAWEAYDALTAAGFDIALSYALTVDHGLVQAYDMVLGSSGVPMVPLVVNTAAPPLPTLSRCAELGSALGRGLRAGTGGRVLVVASGGLSHWLPSNDPRDDMPAERRESLIHGRRDLRAFAAVREPRVLAMAGNPTAPVNSEWDHWFLAQLQREGGREAIASLGHLGLERRAGTGGHEVRTWLVGHAAVDLPLVWTAYEPVPEWITGMGIGTTFDTDCGT